MPFKQEKRQNGNYSDLTSWLSDKHDSPDELSLLQEITGLFSHLSPQALTKIVTFDDKFKTVVTKIEDKREEEYLSALASKVSRSGRKVGFLRKMIDQGKKLLRREEDALTAFLKTEGPNLTQLDLSAESVSLDNTDAFIEEMVRFCPNLVTLNANGCKISSRNIEFLKQLPNLEAISFSFCEIEDPEIIRAIADFPKLRDLRLSWNKKLPLEAIHELSKLAPTIEQLDLSHTNITDDELVALAGLCHLKTLKVRDLKNVTGLSLCTFTCSDLINIDISSTSITSKEFKKLIALFPELCSITFRNNHLKDKDLEGISALKNLSHLDLSWSNDLKGEFLEWLADLRFLRILDLSRGQKLRPACKRWGEFQSLMILNLSCTKTDDEICKQISTLPMLSGISLAHSPKITKKGVQSLTLLDHLHYLDLVNCDKITEEVAKYFPSHLEIRL